MIKSSYGSQPIRNELTGITVDFTDLGKLLTNLSNKKMKIKYPKGWNKMSLREQEIFLQDKIQELRSEIDALRIPLAKIRGGNKVKISDEIDRPDLLEMKVAVK